MRTNLDLDTWNRRHLFRSYLGDGFSRMSTSAVNWILQSCDRYVKEEGAFPVFFP